MKFKDRVRLVWNYSKSLGDMNSDSFKNWIRQSSRSGRKSAINEATYFTCIRMMSESIGKMPLHLYQVNEKGTKRVNGMRQLLLRPNPLMTASIFWATLETSRIHFGNAYAYINRDRRGIKDLWIMHPDNVQIIVDDAGIFGNPNGIWYNFTNPDTGQKHTFHGDQVIHLKMSVSNDGIQGVGVRDRLESMIEGSLASQDFLTTLNKEGLTARAVLQYTGDLSGKSETALLEEINKRATGANNAGKIFPLGPGMQIQPLNIKLTDAQYLELRKLTALQIAAAIGVKPNQLNDYEKSSYANSEMQNLAFYTDTLLFVVKQYEEELTYKTQSEKDLEDGLELKFNVGAILRTDQKSQAEIIKGYVNNGIMTPNEARKYLDMESNEHGDKLVMNGNYIPLEKVGAQYGQLS